MAWIEHKGEFLNLEKAEYVSDTFTSGPFKYIEIHYKDSKKSLYFDDQKEAEEFQGKLRNLLCNPHVFNFLE